MKNWCRRYAPSRYITVDAPRAVIGAILGLFVITPVLWIMLTGPKVPAINDITTDYTNPPAFVRPPELSADSMKYDRAKFEPLRQVHRPYRDAADRPPAVAQGVDQALLVRDRRYGRRNHWVPHAAHDGNGEDGGARDSD